MNLRHSLLAAAWSLALAFAPIQAEELQFTISGNTFCSFTGCSGQAITGPGTITFDFNTSSAMLTPTFGPSPFGGPDVLTNLEVSFPLTNYYAVVGGQVIGYSAHGSGGFGCFGFPVSPQLYECGGGYGGASAGGFSFDDSEVWLHTLTEAQYKALDDPLAFMLLSGSGAPCGNAGVTCNLQESDGNVNFASSFVVTRVPTPQPLALFLPGLVGLALWRRWGHNWGKRAGAVALGD